MTEKSPLAPESLPEMPKVAGIKFATAQTGMKYQGRDDLLLVDFPEHTAVAGVFTKSNTPGAPVEWCKTIILHGVARALLVNAGVANVFNGPQGLEIVDEVVTALSEVKECILEEIYVASTGVIGEMLDVEKITTVLPSMLEQLSEDASWEAATNAIGTTDTFPKYTTRTVKIGQTPITINGIVKGSGMIAPDMATMLGYIFTDAKVPHSILQKMLNEYTELTFNAITVDSDTSTSDTVQIFATGQAEHVEIRTGDEEDLIEFRRGLYEVMLDLSKLVVRDGEGASKFIEVQVTGAESFQSAKKIAMTIANSPLVKTAIAGEDANWGRIVMAIGKSEEAIDRDKISIKVGGVVIAENGMRSPAYEESQVTDHMKGKNIVIAVDVGIAEGKFTAWTCDLTHDYITINADYRT